MKYFLTGATGFSGGDPARQFVERGHDVVAIVRTPSKAGPLRELGFSPRPFDLGWCEAVEHGMRLWGGTP